MATLIDMHPSKDNNNSSNTLWYLAYGSNMDPAVMTGRRKIHPLESKAVVVPEYWLSFDIGGIPFVEPCFASILKKDPSRLHERAYALFVHERTKHGQVFEWDPDHPERSYPPALQGVAHRITLQDWDQVVNSEGGWGHDVPTGYDHEQVHCMVLNSDHPPLDAHVLTARPASIKTRCQPTARYKDLLTVGAAHHHLDPSYQHYLATLVPYECTGLRSRIGRALFMVFNYPMMLAFAFLFRRNRGKAAHELTRPPFWMAWYFDKASRFSNACHDYLVAPFLGSGRCSTVAHSVVLRKRIEHQLAQKDSNMAPFPRTAAPWSFAED